MSTFTGGRNRGRNSLRIGRWLLAQKSTLSRLKNFLVLRARVRDDAGQVAADRARAGEKFLMAHFPASLSMNRLAGSSGTQKVCEASKSRNRTGSVISKSGRSGLSQMPAAMTQRGLKHPSERRQLKVSGGVPRGRRCPEPCCSYVSSRAHRKLLALPPTQRHHVLQSHRKSHERSSCAPAPDSEESSLRPDGMVRTLFR